MNEFIVSFQLAIFHSRFTKTTKIAYERGFLTMLILHKSATVSSKELNNIRIQNSIAEKVGRDLSGVKE